jgi:hypothetical protein
MKYRSERIYGEGHLDATKVIQYEIFELRNTDILDTLAKTILKDSDISLRLTLLSELISNGDENSKTSIAEDIVHEIYRFTGKKIRYVLWLCDTKEDVKSYSSELDNDDIDCYYESDLVLSDLGREGKLYGYEFTPRKVK